MQEALLSSLPKLVNLMSSTVEGLVLVFLFVKKLGAWEIEIVPVYKRPGFVFITFISCMACCVQLFFSFFITNNVGFLQVSIPIKLILSFYD